MRQLCDETRGEKKSLQSGVETAILKTTWVRERGLSRGMVLLLEVEDDLVSGVSKLEKLMSTVQVVKESA